MARPKEKRSL